MKAFDLGPGVRCDLDVLLSTRLLIQANSGGGKSWALRRLLEQTSGQVQQLVIDPEGEFATLRERFDYVLAAKQGGDTLADPRAARLLAERLLELGVSAVLDIYELKAHERVRFVKLFCEALVDAPKALWHPVLVVLDEAHVYAPEKGSAESLQAVIDLATRGRKRGFCLVQATQRLSKLHKDAAAEMNNKLIGRSALDVDMDRAGDELGFSKADRQRLRHLEAGEFYAFGPALSRTVTKVRVGPVATSHPKAGAKLAAVVPPPTDRVRAVLAKLADLPAEAEQRERTLADLQRENATLKRQLAAAGVPAPTPVEVLTEQDRALLTALEARLGTIGPEFDGHVGDRVDHALVQAAARVAKDVEAITERARAEVRGLLDTKGLARVFDKVGRVAPMRPRSGPLPQLHAPPTTNPGIAAPGPTRDAMVRVAQRLAAGGTLPGPEQKILNAVAELEVLGLHPADKIQVGLLAGYTNVRSGGFSEPLGRLVVAGHVVSPAVGQLAITESGRALAVTPAAPTSPEEMQARVLAKLTGPEQKLLGALLRHYPHAVTKDVLGAECGYTNIRSGGFSEPLGRLNTLGIIRTPARGMVVAAPFLFLEGR